jgi:hypothetical protein
MLRPDLTQLLARVQHPDSIASLQTYFGTDRAPGTLPLYTGGRFELLAGGGDRPDTANRITVDDLVAVKMLKVEVPAEVALELLEGDLGPAVAAELSAIPTDVSIADADGAELLADGGHADVAWHLLEERHDMGWVTTNKLLARKRPHLIAVYDDVVACAFGKPDGLWRWLQPLFCSDGGVLNTSLHAAHRAARLPDAVSALRVLDVIVWMHHRPAHRRHGCPGMEW